MAALAINTTATVAVFSSSAARSLKAFTGSETLRATRITVRLIPRNMNTSLIDADVQPHYVSVVVKGKTIRLELPAECNPDAGVCERSKMTGALKFTLPKAGWKKRLRYLRQPITCRKSAAESVRRTGFAKATA